MNMNSTRFRSGHGPEEVGLSGHPHQLPLPRRRSFWMGRK